MNMDDVRNNMMPSLFFSQLLDFFLMDNFFDFSRTTVRGQFFKFIFLYLDINGVKEYYGIPDQADYIHVMARNLQCSKQCHQQGGNQVYIVCQQIRLLLGQQHVVQRQRCHYDEYFGESDVKVAHHEQAGEVSPCFWFQSHHFPICCAKWQRLEGCLNEAILGDVSESKSVNKTEHVVTASTTPRTLPQFSVKGFRHISQNLSKDYRTDVFEEKTQCCTQIFTAFLVFRVFSLSEVPIHSHCLTNEFRSTLKKAMSPNYLHQNYESENRRIYDVLVNLLVLRNSQNQDIGSQHHNGNYGQKNAQHQQGQIIQKTYSCHSKNILKMSQFSSFADYDGDHGEQGKHQDAPHNESGYGLRCCPFILFLLAYQWDNTTQVSHEKDSTCQSEQDEEGRNDDVDNYGWHHECQYHQYQ